MNNKLFCAIVIVFVELFAASNAHAIFPRRFGCSGGCYTPVVHHAPAVVQQRDIIQQIFFAAPAGYISPVGETVYGLQRALDLNSPDPNAFLNNSNQHIAAATSSSAAARQVSADILGVESLNAEARRIRETSQGSVNVIRALAGEQVQGDQPRAVLLTLRNGVYESVREIKPDVQAEAQPVPRGFDGLTCIKCHGVGGKAAAKFVIDDTYDLAKHMKAEAAINNGTMPPDSNLSPAEKATIRLQLGKLVP